MSVHSDSELSEVSSFKSGGRRIEVHQLNMIRMPLCLFFSCSVFAVSLSLPLHLIELSHLTFQCLPERECVHLCFEKYLPYESLQPSDEVIQSVQSFTEPWLCVCVLFLNLFSMLASHLSPNYHAQYCHVCVFSERD